MVITLSVSWFFAHTIKENNMYYVESIIKGKLHYKSSKESPWVLFTVEKLTKRVATLELELEAAYRYKVKS